MQHLKQLIKLLATAHVTPLVPAPPITHLTSSPLHKIDIITAGGRDPSNDIQIRVIGSMQPEIYTKMLRNLTEKLGTKFPAITRSHSRVKIPCLQDAFSDISELEASPEVGQSLQQNYRKRRKRKGQKI